MEKFQVEHCLKGTWFGINQDGLAMALLNRYQDPIKDTKLSRGRFIPKLLLEKNFEAIKNKFQKLHDQNDNSFDLIILSRNLLKTNYLIYRFETV